MDPFYVQQNDTEQYNVMLNLEGSNPILYCISPVEGLANIIAKALNNRKIPDPYEGPPNMTDCEIWSEDLIKVLSFYFKCDTKHNEDAIPSKMEDSKKELYKALVWFYQTHL